MNAVCIIGNLGSDPTITTFPDGGKEAKFNIAYRRNGSDETQWFTCKAKGKQVEAYIEPFIKSGIRVEICGELRQETWETEDGSKRSRVIIIVKEIGTVGSPRKDEGENSPQESNKEDMPSSNFADLPF